MDPQERKLTLPAFLKVLTSNNVPVPKAMAVASKVCVYLVSMFAGLTCENRRYKEFNTSSLLAQLTDTKLKVCGVEEKETRKIVLAAIRKAGYTVQRSSSARPKRKSDESRGSDEQPVAGPSQPRIANTVQVLVIYFPSRSSRVAC